MCRFLRSLVLILVCPTLWAQNVLQLYTTSELQEIGGHYAPNLRGMWDEDFLAQVTRDERLRTGSVTLNLPLTGKARYPLEFYSSPAQRQVFLPIASVKFIDDMAVAFAYYNAMGCDQGIVSDYAAVLRFRPQDAKGPPLETLGVPRTVLQDPKIDDGAQKILKSIIFFVSAHEYAHVMYRHKDDNTITAQQAQQQEVQADAFALEVMRRIGVAPLALVYFFLISTRLEASPGDFASPAEYENYVRNQATHPVSALRILKIADYIQDNTDAFARLQPNPQLTKTSLQQLVPQLREIGNTLDDRKMRLFLAQRAQSANVASFRVACPHQTYR